MAHLAANLGVSGRDKGIRLLLEPDPGFPAASALVVAGLELAASISSSLVDDLLPHVAGFAMITGAEHGRLGSASLRDYPGLIVLPRPSSALEVAEALVHEGAHQLLFDLCVTCTMLGTSDSATPTFRPSWSPASRPTWPLAQALAAFHAYTCLATFFQLINASDASTVVHDSSLLPQAAQRADEIGGWLVHHSEHLGTDGRDFVRLLRGTTELSGRGSRRGDEPGVIVDFQADASRPTAVRDCGEWTLVARRGSSIELFWIKSTAG
jgi:hypothetical protein